MRKSYERTGERRRSPFPLTSISSPFCQSLVSSLHHLKMDGKLQHNSKVTNARMLEKCTNARNMVFKGTPRFLADDEELTHHCH